MTPTILIVDDSPSVHQLVSSCFVADGWHVCSAYTGTDGLAAAASRGAEVVLLDLDLPDMNGFDVCRHLRDVAAGSAVIFLTSSASVDEKVCGLHLSGVDYITKPFDPAELTQRVRNAVRTKRRLGGVADPAAAPASSADHRGGRRRAGPRPARAA